RVGDHRLGRVRAVGGERRVLPPPGPGDRPAGSLEQARSLLEEPSLAGGRSSLRLRDERPGPREQTARVGRHGLAAAGALIEVTVEGAEDGREAHLRFRGPAFGGRTRAALRRGARVRFGAARRPRGLQRVGRAGVADAVAALFHVTGAGRRAADRRALAVGRAVVAHAVAALFKIAGAGRGSADRGGLAVGGAGGAGARAGLGHIAVAGRGTALDGGWLESIGRARAVRPGAELGLVARAHGPAALERRGLEQ